MGDNEMFYSAVRSAGDQVGVFEYDGDTGYFYLYDTRNEENRKIVAAIRVLVGTPDFEEQDVAICWDSTESKVGLFIHEQLWAVFDCRTGAEYGGDYHASSQPEIPMEITNSFKTR